MKKQIRKAFLVSVLIFLAGVSVLQAPFSPAGFSGGSIAAAADEKAVPPFLQLINKRLANYFYKLGVELAHNVGKISELGLNSPESRTVIDGIMKKHSFIANCSIVDASGRLIAIVPAEYKGHEGKDISAQAHFIKLKQNKKPVLSGLFEAVEGFKAIALHYPITDKKSELIGSISILMRPEIVFHEILSPLIAGAPVTLLLVQTDGVILFGRSPEEIGANIFDKKLFGYIKNFEDVAGLMKSSETGASEIIVAAAAPSGSLTGEVAAASADARRAVYWVSCGLLDTKWRLIMAPSTFIGGSETPASAGTAEIEKRAEKAAAELVNEPEFISGVESGDKEKARERLKSFYESCAGIYCVQWVDASLVSRGGWPADRSFADYDFRQERVPRDNLFVESFNSGAVKNFVSPLIEGGTGKFYLYPVKKGDKQVGMVYYIILTK